MVNYTLPIVAGAGLAAATLAATDLSGLTQRGTAAIGLAGLAGGSIVAGVVYAVTKYDQVKLARLKKYDIISTTFLSRQIEEMAAQIILADKASIANQERMLESLRTLRDEAQRATIENHEIVTELATLRSQFMAVSRQMHETDLLLHSARAEMHAASLEMKHTADALSASERDRRSVREQVADLRSGQRSQDTRLELLEHEHIAEQESTHLREGVNRRTPRKITARRRRRLPPKDKPSISE